MNRVLRFYDYGKCFEHYSQCLLNIRQAKIKGEVIIAKPALLLALIDGVNEGEFIGNKFLLTEWLEKKYTILMKEYVKDSQFPKITDIENPFWHLASDGFWHLQCKEDPKEGVTPSSRWLKENVEFARFDDDLWLLLQNREWRLRLRNFIIENKLPQSYKS